MAQLDPCEPADMLKVQGSQVKTPPLKMPPLLCENLAETVIMACDIDGLE